MAFKHDFETGQSEYSNNLKNKSQIGEIHNLMEVGNPTHGVIWGGGG